MNSLLALRALLYVGELFAVSALILTLAWLGISQKAASARHLSWAGALGVTLALPMLTAIVPSTIRILLALPAELPPPRSLNYAALVAASPGPAERGFIDASTLVFV